MVRYDFLVFTSLFTLLTLVDSKLFKIQPRITNGQDAVVGQFPYVASLRVKATGIGFCGGTIITQWHVVSAGHCIANRNASVNDIVIVIGAWHIVADGYSINVQRAIVHPKFDSILLRHDISVLKTWQSIQFTSRIQPITLPTIDVQSVSGLESIVSGWGWAGTNGRRYKTVLQYQKTFIINKSDCFMSIMSAGIIDFSLDDTICTFSQANEGIGRGDSGSGLIAKDLNGFDVFIGIASWALNRSMGCPDVYTSVYHHAEFIYEQMKN